jgi:DNA polymerase (family X)
MERRAGRESLDAHHAQHGLLDLPDLIEAASAFDYAFVAFTDHSKSLKIAGGMYEDEPTAVGAEIDTLNADAAPLRILKGIEITTYF